MVRMAFSIALGVVASSAAFASGSVTCNKVDKSLPPVTFSWGTGHVEGGGRISPYRLTLSGRDVLINDGRDAAHVKQEKLSGERVTATEVGYWNGPDRIMVWLADDQVSKQLLKLDVVKSKEDRFEGKLSVTDVKGITLKDVTMGCTAE